jgi:predicted enzyme related to lactoylglutathione lyase
MADTRLYRVILPTTDIERSSRFFASVFEQEGDRVSPGRHYFDCDGVILAVYDPKADGDAQTPGWEFHESQYLYFSVTNLEDVRDRVKDAGGEMLSDIESMPWGETLFYATEPCGGRICFADAETLFTGN